MGISMTMPNTLGNVSEGWMPAFDAGVVNIMVRNSRIASAPGGGAIGAGAAGLHPAPNSDAMNPRMAINFMGESFGRTLALTRAAAVRLRPTTKGNRRVECS